MATKTTIETWPKSSTSQAQIDAERQARLDAGATSSTITEDTDDWILTTVWPVVAKAG